MSSDFRETLYTVDKTGKRNWVYPTVVKGFFYRNRTVVIILLLLNYLSLPWLTVANKQAVFLDIFNRRFVFFGQTFWATDTGVLAIVLGALGVSLFFFTALLGRVWCGWACPETVFLEFVFRPIENLIEGSPAQRKKLDQGPWDLNKIIRKGLKYLVFIVLSWFIASTFLAYFLGRERLLEMMRHSPSQNIEMFVLTLAMMGVMLFQFGWFREQFCTVLCPYARFQSVLMDANSILVGYDKSRGEPRGKSKDSGSGDCVDCGLCLRVCPTGIDIRNGTQLECIHCAACVDACDSIMVKLNRPKGLIRYSTENQLEGKAQKIFRPRVVIYGLILFIYFCAFIYYLSHRQLTDVRILRGKTDAPFSILENNRLINHFTLHVSNKGEEENNYFLKVHDNSQVEATVPLVPFNLKADSDASIPVFFQFNKELLHQGKASIEVEVYSEKGFSTLVKVTLLGPDE